MREVILASPRDTPTCVGKRDFLSSNGFCTKGHPHVCGEERGFLIFAGFGVGTPPRVWGRGGRIGV